MIKIEQFQTCESIGNCKFCLPTNKGELYNWKLKNDSTLEGYFCSNGHFWINVDVVITAPSLSRGVTSSVGREPAPQVRKASKYSKIGSSVGKASKYSKIGSSVGKASK